MLNIIGCVSVTPLYGTQRTEMREKTTEVVTASSQFLFLSGTVFNIKTNWTDWADC